MTTSAFSVIPKPASIEATAGSFTLGPQTVLSAANGGRPEAELFSEQLSPATGFKLKVLDSSTTPPADNVVRFELVPDTQLGEEGYELNVTPSGIHIRSYRPAGLFYACQTLRQLLPPDVLGTRVAPGTKWTIPGVHVRDVARFAWRGHLFDVGRHFFKVDDVKRAIDLLALHKANVFHWHLTEDQGWRVEIKRYPKLTEVGAWRLQKDGSRYGGFYTQDEIRDVVAYAARRHVKVVPEIEMPGHSTAVLASYPEVGCTGGPYQVLTDWGVYKDVYCPGQEQTYQFIYNVLDEVLQLFPSQYIHIGGDECPKERWTSCPKCQARKNAEGLKDEHELQSYFVRRIDKYLAERGRRLVGWDEILEGGLAPGAVVQSWRGIKGGIAAANAGHDVIMSPTSHCYLDYSYATTSLEKSYSFEPIPTELAPDKAKHVLGLEGNMWTEWVPNMERYDFQVYPRMAALAEVGWSQPQGRSWEEFSARMDEHSKRFLALGMKAGPADEMTTANAVVIGKWSADQMKEAGTELEWDVTEQIKSAGKYEAIPWYSKGHAALEFEWMALLQNGTEVGRDTHVGWSGADKRDLVYRFEVKKAAPGTRFTLKGFAKPMGSTESFGDVYFRKAKKQIQ
ncbi:MAG: beta-N-acetylhexosaminidase [Candidatus Sumerlaeaceae bacterium]